MQVPRINRKTKLIVWKEHLQRDQEDLPPKSEWYEAIWMPTSSPRGSGQLKSDNGVTTCDFYFYFLSPFFLIILCFLFLLCSLPVSYYRPAKEKPQRKRLSVKAVNEILKAHGIETDGSRKVSQCLRAGIMRNKVKLLKPEDDPENKYGLDQVRIHSWELCRCMCVCAHVWERDWFSLLQILKDGACFFCGERLKCTVRDVLYQPDYAGMDYVVREVS